MATPSHHSNETSLACRRKKTNSTMQKITVLTLKHRLHCMKMTLPSNLVVLFFLFFLSNLIDRSKSVSPCIYDSSPKGIIDLTSVGRTDGTPAWKNVEPEKSDKHLYSYNPCRPFNQSSCASVAACQTYATDEKLAYSLGTQNSIQWKIIPGGDLPTILYTSGERTLHIELRCLKSGQPNKLDVYGFDDITKVFTMTLSSKCACWDGCKGGGGSGTGSGLSGGLIFILILLVLAVTYVLVFLAYNKIKRQATGVDILPHRTFWILLPRYALDGVLFVFGKVTRRTATYNSV